MGLRERCLLMEQAIYTEEEVPAGPSECSALLECLEEELGAHTSQVVAINAGKMVRGGGGWLSIAARSP